MQGYGDRVPIRRTKAKEKTKLKKYSPIRKSKIFDFDAQGALDGQYWGIYYSPDDEFCDEYGVEELDEDHRYYREDGGKQFFCYRAIE